MFPILSVRFFVSAANLINFAIVLLPLQDLQKFPASTIFRHVIRWIGWQVIVTFTIFVIFMKFVIFRNFGWAFFATLERSLLD